MFEDGNKIALLYHANLNHVSLSPRARESLAIQHMSDMLAVVNVPATISMPAEDLLFLYLFYPETYTDLIHNPQLSFLLSTYAHVIADIDFGAYIHQQHIAKKIFKTLIPADKLGSVGYPSEVELPPEYSFSTVRHMWQGVILGETRVHTKVNTEKNDHLSWRDPSSQDIVPVAVSRRKSNYRPAFHAFLRDEVSEASVLEALSNDAHRWAGEHGHIARIDLEAPILNEVLYPNNTSSGPRIDRWQQLHQYFEQYQDRFISVQDVFKSMAQIPTSEAEISRSSAEDYKWQYDSNRATIETIGNNLEIGTPEWYFWLSTHHSDYFCTEFNDWCFKMSGGGMIRIAKNQEYREPEIQAKIAVLQGDSIDYTAEHIAEYVQKIIYLSQYFAHYE